RGRLDSHRNWINFRGAGHSPELWWEALSPVFVRAFEAGGLDSVTSRTLAGRVREVYTDPNYWRLFDDTLSALQMLSSRGWTHLVLSNHVPELARIIDALGLGDHVERVFNSADSGHEKPHPLAFENLLEALDRPGKILMIGDNPEADVRGAEAAGIPAILVRGSPDGARRHCRNLFGVADIVGQA
ncbi:MAG: HAD-IA family hydrolase, partial [Rubrobacter sp.]